MTDLLVPFRFGDDPARDAAWRYVRQWYREIHPGFLVSVGHALRDELWSKGRSVHRAFKRSRGDVLVIADADVIVAPELLLECIEAVGGGEPWAQPHSMVYRLNEYVSTRLYATTKRPPIRSLGNQNLERRAHNAAAGGGIVVLTRKAYETVGGIDPRFIGWGGEDISLARALDTLVGPCYRPGGVMWHLWHRPAERGQGHRASVGTEQLAARYLDASGDVDAMSLIVSEW